MIFTVIAEDFGFIGSVVVIALYLLLIYRMLRLLSNLTINFTLYLYRIYHDALVPHFESLHQLPVTGLLPLTSSFALYFPRGISHYQ